MYGKNKFTPGVEGQLSHLMEYIDWKCGESLIPSHSFQGLTEAGIYIDPSLNCESRMENFWYSLGRKLICHSCCEDINPAGVKKFNDMSKTCTSVIPCCEKLLCQKREPGHPLGWVSKLKQKRKRKAVSQGANPNPPTQP